MNKNKTHSKRLVKLNRYDIYGLTLNNKQSEELLHFNQFFESRKTKSINNIHRHPNKSSILIAWTNA